jgi:hypothetical protein
VCASGPIVSSVRESGKTPCLSIRPSLVLNPTMPQKPAGARIEPPVSLPIAQGARPPATATAAPDEDPPATRGVVGSGIPRRAEMRIEPQRREGEFREIGLAQSHHAGRGQVRDDRRVVLFRQRVGIERRSCGGALARHVDKVLPRDGDAIERPCRASFAVTLAARLRLLQGSLARDENERRIVAIALDAAQKEFRNLDRVEPASRDEAPDFRGG